MDLVLELITALSRWSRSNLSEIALAIMATLLVLIGPLLNAWLQRTIGGLNFIVRTLIFIVFCALVYGCAIVFLSPWLKTALAQLNNFTLAPVLVLIFVLIGILAERR